jgi:hypothetical protein
MSLITEVQGILDSVFANTLIPGTSIAENITFSSRTRAAYDPATGAPEESEFPDTLTVPAAIKVYTAADAARAAFSTAGAGNNKANDLIRAGDLSVTLQPSDDLTDVKPGDKFSWNGGAGRAAAVYQVVSVSPKRLNGTTLVWSCLARA